MTEQQWLECNDPGRMITYLSRSKRHSTTSRKLRLFACASCRQIWDLMNDQRSRHAVEMAERFADGQVSREELITAGIRSVEAEQEASEHWGEPTVPAGAARAAEKASRIGIPKSRQEKLAIEIAVHVALCTSNDVMWTEVWSSLIHSRSGAEPVREQMRKSLACQCKLFRDVVPNPFRPIAADPAWHTPTVVALAQAAYDNRILPAGTLEPDRLSVLADALEEASCDNADILNHLRQPGDHVRGCWAVDLALNKS